MLFWVGFPNEFFDLICEYLPTDGPSSNNNHDCLCITLWLILGMVLLISNTKVVTFFPHDMIEFWDNRQFRSGVLGKGGEEKEEAVEDGAHSGGGGIWRWQLIRWRKIHTRWRGTDVGDWLLAARRHHDRVTLLEFELHTSTYYRREEATVHKA